MSSAFISQPYQWHNQQSALYAPIITSDGTLSIRVAWKTKAKPWIHRKQTHHMSVHLSSQWIYDVVLLVNGFDHTSEHLQTPHWAAMQELKLSSLTCVLERDRDSVLAPWTRWLPSSTSSAPLPPPASSCSPATLHIHLLPPKLLPPFDGDPCRAGRQAACIGGWLSVQCCSAEDERASRIRSKTRDD